MGYTYKNSILGGTFDHLHDGHIHFLKNAFNKSEFVTIGLTSDEMNGKKKLFSAIETFNVRKQNLSSFLKLNGYTARSKIILIEDIYGNTLIEKELDTIFVTSSVIKKAQFINKKREEKGWPLLEIIEIPLLESKSGKVVSSTAIREGDTDGVGSKYLDLFKISGYLNMPESLRNELKEPFGRVVADLSSIDHKNVPMVIAVGDIVVSKLVRFGILPAISIYDGKTERKIIEGRKILDNIPSATNSYINNPGTINPIVAVRISEFIKNNLKSKKNYSIKIEGEEDLLALPSILFAPLGCIVVYGISGVGAVVVEVTTDKKAKIYNLLKRFTKGNESKYENLNIVLRSASEADSKDIFGIFTKARSQMRYLPVLHTVDETRKFINKLMGDGGVSVALKNDVVVGFIEVKKGWVHHLYISPNFQGKGVGTALLDFTKSNNPGGLFLWVFESNKNAIRFYERKGFTLVQKRDEKTTTNEEHLADRKYQWVRS